MKSKLFEKQYRNDRSMNNLPHKENYGEKNVHNSSESSSSSEESFHTAIHRTPVSNQVAPQISRSNENAQSASGLSRSKAERKDTPQIMSQNTPARKYGSIRFQENPVAGMTYTIRDNSIRSGNLDSLVSGLESSKSQTNSGRVVSSLGNSQHSGSINNPRNGSKRTRGLSSADGSESYNDFKMHLENSQRANSYGGSISPGIWNDYKSETLENTANTAMISDSLDKLARKPRDSLDLYTNLKRNKRINFFDAGTNQRRKTFPLNGPAQTPYSGTSLHRAVPLNNNEVIGNTVSPTDVVINQRVAILTCGSVTSIVNFNADEILSVRNSLMSCKSLNIPNLFETPLSHASTSCPIIIDTSQRVPQREESSSCIGGSCSKDYLK